MGKKRIDLTDVLNGKVTKLPDIDFNTKENRAYLQKLNKQSAQLARRNSGGVHFMREVPLPRRNWLSCILYRLIFR